MNNYSLKKIPYEVAETDFDRLIELCQKEPIEITKDGEGVAVILSSAYYQELKNSYDAMQCSKDKLKAAIEEAQSIAAKNGLTQEILDEILAEDN